MNQLLEICFVVIKTLSRGFLVLGTNLTLFRSILENVLSYIRLSFFPFVPQAEFSEINLASYVNSGCMVDMQVNKGGSKVVR